MPVFETLQVNNLFLIQDNYSLFQKRLKNFQFCWYVISAVITLLTMNFSNSLVWYSQLIFLFPILFPLLIFQLVVEKRRLKETVNRGLRALLMVQNIVFSIIVLLGIFILISYLTDLQSNSSREHTIVMIDIISVLSGILNTLLDDLIKRQLKTTSERR